MPHHYQHHHPCHEHHHQYHHLLIELLDGQLCKGVVWDVRKVLTVASLRYQLSHAALTLFGKDEMSNDKDDLNYDDDDDNQDMLPRMMFTSSLSSPHTPLQCGGTPVPQAAARCLPIKFSSNISIIKTCTEKKKILKKDLIFIIIKIS